MLVGGQYRPDRPCHHVQDALCPRSRTALVFGVVSSHERRRTRPSPGHALGSRRAESRPTRARCGGRRWAAPAEAQSSAHPVPRRRSSARSACGLSGRMPRAVASRPGRAPRCGRSPEWRRRVSPRRAPADRRPDHHGRAGADPPRQLQPRRVDVCDDAHARAR